MRFIGMKPKSNSHPGAAMTLEFCDTASRLHPDDVKHLIAAEGYAELGMFLDADAEIENIHPEVRDVPEILAIRLAIYRALENWELMQMVVRKLRKLDPENSRWVILHAFATRQAKSIEAAKAVLLDAWWAHDNEPLIPFMLASYECQQGHFEKAEELVKFAISLDSRLRALALDDEDLRPLWESIGAFEEVSKRDGG